MTQTTQISHMKPWGCRNRLYPFASLRMTRALFALLCGHLSNLRNLRSLLGAETERPIAKAKSAFAVKRRDEACAESYKSAVRLE
jgi:hypothetical protein